MREDRYIYFRDISSQYWANWSNMIDQLYQIRLLGRLFLINRKNDKKLIDYHHAVLSGKRG
jgi:hypothetical protein